MTGVARRSVMSHWCHLTRRSHRCAVVPVLLVLFPLGCRSEPPPIERSDVPNVMLITLDTTRADRLHCYGYSRATSPHLDALAADGTLFERAIAQSAATPISHASILTGLNPYQHGVRVIYAKGGCQLPERVETLATMLRTGGWQTGAFVSSFTVSSFYGFDRGFDLFDEPLSAAPNAVMQERDGGGFTWNRRTNQRRSDETTGAALAWLRRVKRPFFLWAHYWDPHDDVLVPPGDVLSRFPATDSRPRAADRALYDAEIFYMDRQLGRMIQFLKDTGEYDNTLFVVVADHGQGLGDHGWWHHRILYQEQIRVPLIVRLPQHDGAPRIADCVRTIDIVPTVLDALGQKAVVKLEGASLLPLMAGQAAPQRLAYADALNLYDLNARLIEHRPQDDLVYCATDGRWKLVHRPRHPDRHELFDLRLDPGERLNLYSPTHPEARRLKAALDRWDGYVDEGFEQGYDAEVIDALRSLGYIDAAEPDDVDGGSSTTPDVRESVPSGDGG